MCRCGYDATDPVEVLVVEGHHESHADADDGFESTEAEVGCVLLHLQVSMPPEEKLVGLALSFQNIAFFLLKVGLQSAARLFVVNLLFLLGGFTLLEL